MQLHNTAFHGVAWEVVTLVGCCCCVAQGMLGITLTNLIPAIAPSKTALPPAGLDTTRGIFWVRPRSNPQLSKQPPVTRWLACLCVSCWRQLHPDDGQCTVPLLGTVLWPHAQALLDQHQLQQPPSQPL